MRLFVAIVLSLKYLGPWSKTMVGAGEALHIEAMNATQLFSCSTQMLSVILRKYLVLWSEAEV